MLSDFVYALTQELSERGVPFGDAIPIGFAEPEKYGYPPRVVLVPTLDTFGPSEWLATDQPVLLTRNAGADLYIWHRTFDQASILVHEVAAAIQRIARSSVAITGGAWRGDAKADALGVLYVLTLSISIPILDTPYQIAPTDTSAHSTGYIVLPSGDFASCNGET